MKQVTNRGKKKKMKILFYYSDSCRLCKDYEETVDKLSKVLNISLEKENIDVIKPSYKLNGVPTIILENNGVEIYRSVGNLPFQQLYKEMKEYT